MDIEDVEFEELVALVINTAKTYPPEHIISLVAAKIIGSHSLEPAAPLIIHLAQIAYENIPQTTNYKEFVQHANTPRPTTATSETSFQSAHSSLTQIQNITRQFAWNVALLMLMNEKEIVDIPFTTPAQSPMRSTTDTNEEIVRLLASQMAEENDVITYLLGMNMITWILRRGGLDHTLLPMLQASYLSRVFSELETLRDTNREEQAEMCMAHILAINEQYLQLKLDQNEVIKFLIDNKQHWKTFGESLLFMLNREEHIPTRLLLIKTLYTLFSHKVAVTMFYTNDLRIVIDVTCRELHDLPAYERETEPLREAFLRLLCPVLKNTSYLPPEETDFTLYKVKDLRAALASVLKAETYSNDAADDGKTIQKLVQRVEDLLGNA